MKEELITLAKEKGFESTFLYNQPMNYSSKEELRWLFWITELQQFLRDNHQIEITVITNYSHYKEGNLTGKKTYRGGIIYIENNLIESFFLRPENDKYLFIEFETFEQCLQDSLIQALNLIKPKEQ